MRITSCKIFPPTDFVPVRVSIDVTSRAEAMGLAARFYPSRNRILAALEYGQSAHMAEMRDNVRAVEDGELYVAFIHAALGQGE